MKVSEEIVWVLYYQLVIWLTMIFFPYAAILQTFCIYVVFMAYYIYVTRLAEKPLSQSNKENTGILIMFFLNLSILVWITVIITLLVLKFKHGNFTSDGEVHLCGPFKDDTNWQEEYISFFEGNQILSRVIFLFQNYPFVILMAILLLAYV